MISALFIVSGIGLLQQVDGTITSIRDAGLPLPHVAFAAGVGIDIVGGLMLAIGYWTRPVTLVLAVFSLLTAVMFHVDFESQAAFLHFFMNIALAGGLLQLASFGGGCMSLDGGR
jgi:putative oxidoreductase